MAIRMLFCSGEIGATSQRRRSAVAATSERRRSAIAATSERRRSAIAAPSARRRPDVAAPSQRHRPDIGPTSQRHRSDIGPTSERRRSVIGSDIGPTSQRHRSDIGPTSERRRSAIAATSTRRRCDMSGMPFSATIRSSVRGWRNIGGSDLILRGVTRNPPIHNSPPIFRLLIRYSLAQEYKVFLAKIAERKLLTLVYFQA